MSGHTPGPWRCIWNGHYWDIHSFCEDGKFAHFSISDTCASNENAEYGIPGTAEANARLIASAPDLKADNDRLRAVNAELLEALEEVLDTANAPHESDHALAVHNARAAIAKAKGDDHA